VCCVNSANIPDSFRLNLPDHLSTPQQAYNNGPYDDSSSSSSSSTSGALGGTTRFAYMDHERPAYAGGIGSVDVHASSLSGAGASSSIHNTHNNDTPEQSPPASPSRDRTTGGGSYRAEDDPLAQFNQPVPSGWIVEQFPALESGSEDHR
jgi:hypothetical protein